MARKPIPWGPLGLYGGGGLLVILMIYGGLKFPQTVTPSEASSIPGVFQGSSQGSYLAHPVVELLKLIAAAGMAMMVTYLNRHFHGDKPLGKSLEQAQVLLCVAGALMMIIIGNSLARAFGVAGAAGIVRFRTPVEDPRDSVVLFLLLALGMAVGLGLFAVAGLGVLFLCLFLIVLHRFGESLPKTMMLHVGSELEEFPTAFVQGVFRQRRIQCEPREVGAGTAKFSVQVPPDTNLEAFNFELLNHPGNFVNSVEWSEPVKKKKGEEP